MKEENPLQDAFQRIAGRLLQHSMMILCVLGGAVSVAYLTVVFGIRDQQHYLERVKTSAEQADVVETINLLLIRKTLADASKAVLGSDEMIQGGLNRLEHAHAASVGDQNTSLDTLLKDYTAAVKQLQKIPPQQWNANPPELRHLLVSLTPRLQQEMQSVSSRNQQQSEAMLAATANKQHWMFAVSLGSLAIVGVLLLRPLLSQLKVSALREGQDKSLMDKIIDTAQIPIFGLDAVGNVVLMNRHAEQHSGWLGDDIKGCGFFERLIPVERREELQALFNDMMSGARAASAQTEALMVTASGEKMPMTWKMAVLEEPSTGKPNLFLITAAEVVERKHAGEASTTHLRPFNVALPEDILIYDNDLLIRSIANSGAGNIIRMPESLYRRSERPIAQAAKDSIAFFTEDGYSGFPGHFDQDRICRILPRQNEFCNKLGWNRLLNQHNESLDDDLYALMPGKSEYRHFGLKHTDDETAITESVNAWLQEGQNLPNDLLDAILTVLDEMIENSLYSAPRDSGGMPYYAKGETRKLASYEEVTVDVARGGDILGLMITDYWGTLTPGIFFKSLARAMEDGIETRDSGVGLYMIWRLSDYLQIRVHPQKCTQVTVLWDISGGFIDHHADAGLQFLYHNDYEASYQMRASI